jgi:TRAP transporter TAXI family solute receptor
VFLKKFFAVYFPIVVFIFVLFYFTSRFVEPAVERKLTIAAGSKSGQYYQTALEYKKLLEEQKVEVTILQSEGSINNVELLKTQKADIGFVQSGILNAQTTKNLESLASVYYEPIWIFYQNEGFEIDYLVQLVSKKIAVGTQGSGTHHLAMQLLNDNGINEDNTTFIYANSADAQQMLLKKEIDALILVASPLYNGVQTLLENPNINVLNIKRAQAYSMKYPFLCHLTLFEGTMDLYKNIPYNDINLLSTTANLVAHNNIPDDLIRLFIKVATQVHSKKSLFEKQNAFPNLNNLDTTVNEAAKKYILKGDSWLESIFPFWVASNIDRLKIMLIPLLTLLIPLFKGVMPLYTWTMRSKIYKWYDELNHIDKTIINLNAKELQEQLNYVETLRVEIGNQTKVPLSFMGEYYNLLLHLDMISNKIKANLQQ